MGIQNAKLSAQNSQAMRLKIQTRPYLMTTKSIASPLPGSQQKGMAEKKIKIRNSAGRRLKSKEGDPVCDRDCVQRTTLSTGEVLPFFPSLFHFSLKIPIGNLPIFSFKFPG